MMQLLKGNIFGIILLLFGDLCIGIYLARLLFIRRSRLVKEALGARNKELSVFRRCSGFAVRGLTSFEKRIGKTGIYEKARIKMKRAGYKGEHAATLYLLVKWVAAPLFFLSTLALNYPEVIRAAASAVLLNAVIEIVIASGRKKLNMRFQKYIYKVYKYLHNQVSSGVKPTDAVRSAYEIVEDPELRDALIRMAARYELTLDIDGALEEFRSHFDAHEAETLCVALKQGVETGDNSDLLARQEDMMFKKYFNYVQAETDSCKNRSLAAASVFVSIMAVMIIVPMAIDVGQAVGKIFIN